jgi:uncharacterized protein YraI
MRAVKLIVLLCLLITPLATVLAQDSGPSVTVTTQDFVSLRTGPGKNFERVAVIDPGVTLAAIGRSVAGDWIQVDYNGQHGWVSAGWVTWYGDVASLPVDGVDPLPYVRRALAEGVTTRETPIYRRQITPEDQVGTLPAGTEVELTGRLGSGAMYQIQILYEGQLYWVGSWNIRVTGGSDRNLFDTAYMYAFGRLLSQLDRDIWAGKNRLGQIESIWQRLKNGESVRCTVPDYVSRGASDVDVSTEPIFAPLVQALDGGIASTNSAISAFADACARAGEDFYLTEQEVNAALAHVDDARRYLNVAASLLASLRGRDPVLGGGES